MTSQPPASTPPDRQLQMNVAGNIIHHLGLKMYRGAVGAIAELVSNSWDADAPSVDITLPVDRRLQEDDEIIVEDNGLGMTYEEIQENYLDIGYNRRRKVGEYTLGGRKVIGKKGIGKLAGFGIANWVEVRSVKDGWAVTFRMDYTGIMATGNLEDYKPVMLEDGPTDDPTGTTVRLKNLTISASYSQERFLKSMARRFNLWEEFEVKVNGERVTAYHVDTVLKIEMGSEDFPGEIDGVGEVTGWIGFANKPIREEIDQHGIAVMARGKLIQMPFSFHFVSGGAQFGISYMTGELNTEFLDAVDETETEDSISTSRASILWEKEEPKKFLEWGEKTVKKALRAFNDFRKKETEEEFYDKSKWASRVLSYPEARQKEVNRVVHQIAKLERDIDWETIDTIIELVLNAYDNEQFRELLRRFNEVAGEDISKISEVLSEWSVLEAFEQASIVSGRLGIIKTLGEYIKEGVREIPEVHDLLIEAPWIIDPMWTPYKHERTFDTLLKEEFGEGSGDPEGGRRFDFICLGPGGGTLYVVEVKRPGKTVTKDEFDRFVGYVDFLDQYLGGIHDPGRKRYDKVKGALLYSEIHSQVRPAEIERLEKAGFLFRPWQHVFDIATELHNEFLDAVQSKAAKKLEKKEDKAAEEPSG